MHLYFSKGSFTISELVKVSDFSRPTVNSTIHDALKLGYIEEVKAKPDRRRNDYRPTKPMLDAWRNYCNALIENPKFSHSLRLAQAIMLMRETPSSNTTKYVKSFILFLQKILMLSYKKKIIYHFL